MKWTSCYTWLPFTIKKNVLQSLDIKHLMKPDISILFASWLLVSLLFGSSTGRWAPSSLLPSALGYSSWMKRLQSAHVWGCCLTNARLAGCFLQGYSCAYWFKGDSCRSSLASKTEADKLGFFFFWYLLKESAGRSPWAGGPLWSSICFQQINSETEWVGKCGKDTWKSCRIEGGGGRGRGWEVLCGEQGKRQKRGQNAHHLQAAPADKNL